MVDIFLLVRESQRASLLASMASDAALRRNIIACLEGVLAAVGSGASEKAAHTTAGHPFTKKLFPATHKELLIAALNVLNVERH